MDNANNVYGVIPEIVIYNTLLNMIDFTIKNSKVENKDFRLLWRIFGGNDCYPKATLGNLDLYEQALHIFREENGGRGIKVSIGYNLQRVETGEPSIHILLPSETTDSAPIGFNRGYLGNVIDAGDNIGVPILEADSMVTYNLMITADNVNEMMIVYNWLKSISISFSTQFALEGFKNLKIGGNDLQFNDELVPPHIFHRNFNLSFSYEVIGIDIFNEETLMKGIDFESCGKIVSK